MDLFRSFSVFVLVLVLGILGSNATPLPGNDGSARIDASYKKIWAEQKLSPDSLTTDEEFVRRVYLDITGRTPTATQTVAFLKSTDPQKRSILIKRLVDSPEFAEYFASLWTALFVGYKNDQYTNRIEFRNWFRQKLQSNTGWDQIAREMISVTGTLPKNPSLNWYARHRLDPANLADDTSRLFLGIQLGCARCHNHPHEKWTTEDFYGIAAFYSGIKRDQLTGTEKMQRRQLKEQRTALMEKYKSGQVALAKEGDSVRKLRQDFRQLLRLVDEPTSGKITAEIKGKEETFPAKFLLEPQPAHKTITPREQLALWITSPENPYFARALVNRVWGLMMGKGFVHPVDDMGGSNEPSNPQLLNFLAEDFQKNQYSVKHLVYSIANSRTYQLSSKSTAADPPQYYERGKVTMLNADQLINSLIVVNGLEPDLRKKKQDEYEERKQMIYLQLVHLFDNDDSNPVVEFEGTIPQALLLLNGRLTNETTDENGNRPFDEMIARKDLNEEGKIRWIYLQTLSRNITNTELAALEKHLQGNEGRAIYQDIMWTLMNSNEFLFNH